MAYYDFYQERKVSTVGRALNQRFAHIVAAAVTGHIDSRSPRIVEIGTGEGRIADLLQINGEYIGYEPSPSLAHRATERGLTVRQEAVPPLREDDGTVDAVVLSHVLEHVDGYRAAAALFTEIKRVLRPGGCTVLVAPDFKDMGGVFFDVDYSHNFVTTPNRVIQMARDTGFRIETRRFIYGALPRFPGMILNLMSRALWGAVSLIVDNYLYEYRGISKARYLFSRSFMLVMRKPD
jgi:SAM-dependent methyltransferase